MNFIPDSTLSSITFMKPILLSITLALPLLGQAPDTPIFEQSRNGLREEQTAISEQTKKLHGTEKLLSLKVTVKLLENPTFEKIKGIRSLLQIIVTVNHYIGESTGWTCTIISFHSDTYKVSHALPF